ncbi:hypothetical protein AL523_17960 [Enterococcus gallinarum]|nr:hypothetical protein AL523_17960 [Enterococcus gallinarum]
MVGPSVNDLSHSYIIQKKAIVNKLSFIFKDDKDMNARCATKKARGRRSITCGPIPSLRVGRCDGCLFLWL